MARITIEDCMEQVPNRFQLVQMAAIRAKQLKKGARPLLTSENNKEVVMSLREIAAGLVKPGDAAEAEVAAAAPVFDAPAPAMAASPAADAGTQGEAAAAADETPTEG
jgi:DNA-directed RNA polymerase subunit omega